QLRRLLCAGLVELLAAEGVGEARQRSPCVDLRLRAFGLQIGEGLRELAHLFVLELVGEVPQRSANAETRVAEPPARLVPRAAAMRVRRAGTAPAGVHACL